MKRLLINSFFNRPTLTVAGELLGKYLVVRGEYDQEIALEINEVEAYDGFNDLASHAARGKTARNAPMFGEAGTIYVYFTYGMHFMLNIVTGPKDYPAAVLIRGVGGYNGPAKLTKALGINKSFNNKILGKKSGLWFEDRGVVVAKNKIKRTPRIGVASAGPIWSAKKYRFLLK